MRVYLRITTADQEFCIGDGSPVAERRFTAPEVTMSSIRADARTGTDPDGFDVSMTRKGGIEAMFSVPPVGATLQALAADTGALIATGTISSGNIERDAISLQVRL